MSYSFIKLCQKSKTNWYKEITSKLLTLLVFIAIIFIEIRFLKYLNLLHELRCVKRYLSKITTKSKDTNNLTYIKLSEFEI